MLQVLLCDYGILLFQILNASGTLIAWMHKILHNFVICSGEQSIIYKHAAIAGYEQLIIRRYEIIVVLSIVSTSFIFDCVHA